MGTNHMSDGDLLVHHAILHKRDLKGMNVIDDHIVTAIELEGRGYDHHLVTDLDYRSELMLKADLVSSSLGSMGGGTGIKAPQQGGGIKREKPGDACPMCGNTMVQNNNDGAMCPNCGYSTDAATTMYKRFIDSVTRAHIPSGDYVDPAGRRFPIQVPGDIASAMHAYGLAKPLIPMQQFRRRLITIARRKGQSFVDELPKSWLGGGTGDSDDTKGEEPDAMAKSRKVGTYSVLTKSDAQRFTLGVMYPVDETDSQEEYADEATVEQAAWYFMQKGAGAGYMHITDLRGKQIGDVVESYVYRNPVPWKVTDVSGTQQMIKKGDWVGGVIWTPAVWADILAGKLTGYSIHGQKIVESVG